MPSYHLFVVYLISFLIVFLPSFGLAKMFQKAGVPQWKAFIPYYNTWVMQELAQRPKHWVFWQFIPVVGWFISPGIFIEFVKLYGRFSFWEHALAALLAPFYFPYLGYNDKIHYIGPEGARRYKKPGWREWVDAAIFAVVAATLIRTFIFEAYTIPSGSMEKTLLINDFLFCKQIHLRAKNSQYTYRDALCAPYHPWLKQQVIFGVDQNSIHPLVFVAGNTQRCSRI